MTNPNGANQYILDPRQKMCWELYTNPTSETFGNATQSAIRAGYEPIYADVISTVDWFKGKLRKLNMVSKAEKVLEETLDYVSIDEKGKIDSGVGRLKLDAAKHVTSSLGKDDGYSTKFEVSISKKIKDMSDEEVNEYINKKINESTEADK